MAVDSEMTGHMHLNAGSKLWQMLAFSLLCIFFYSVQDITHEILLPTYREITPAQPNFLRNAQKYVFSMVLNSVSLIMKTNHGTLLEKLY